MTPREALLAFCAKHRCKDCPIACPDLGCIAPGDPCVVTLALAAMTAGVDPDYEAMRADLVGP